MNAKLLSQILGFLKVLSSATWHQWC